MAKIKGIGFGYIPKETKHHFLVRIPRDTDKKVLVFERFKWDESNPQKSEIEVENAKVRLDRHKWNLVKDAIQNELNRTLKENNIMVGKFKTGDTPVDRLLGKEMILLLWAIEDSDPSLIQIAIRNWLGFSREERWWLFTMTNATTGQAYDRRGWRKAIRYAITENPIDDKKDKQLSFFDVI